MDDAQEDLPEDGVAFDLRKLGNELRRESLDPYNRLHSIDLDARFVQQVAGKYPRLPVVANQRCGAWYVYPAQACSANAYFKSTDGHTGQWAFSLRRANLHLLGTIAQHGGLIVVDATRRGKTFPDALSKTIPLWCAVINKARGFEAGLETPEGVVSASEKAQMAAKIDMAATELLGVESAQAMLVVLKKPLQPLFVCRSLPLPDLPDGRSSLPVICLSASDNETAHSRQHGFAYVPGAGDDHESWAQGLMPALFWTNRLQLLSASRDDLSSAIAEVVQHSKAAHSHNTPCIDLLPAGIRFDLAPSAAVTSMDHEPTVLICDEHTPTSDRRGPCIVPIAEGKKGHKALVDALPQCLIFAASALQREERLRVSYTSIDRRDAAIGLTLAILVTLYDEHLAFSAATGQRGASMIGVNTSRYEQSTATKTAIKQRLTWLTTISAGQINPSRAILTRLNGALIDR